MCVSTSGLFPHLRRCFFHEPHLCPHAEHITLSTRPLQCTSCQTLYRSGGTWYT